MSSFSYKCVFLYSGDESGRGGILSPEGQETLSMAKSLLEALAKAILDASVTVEILLLLKKYQQRFLELLTTSSPVADEGGGVKMPTKDETEQSLTDRIEELEKFQAVQEKVLTFTRMCDLIQPGESHFNLICFQVTFSVGFHFFFRWINIIISLSTQSVSPRRRKKQLRMSQ